MQAVLGRKGDYSVRAVLYLARYAGMGRKKAREIAADVEIPDRYVSQILANLVRQQMLAAVAGPDGGYSLAKTPGETTLLEVVEAAEGPIALDECVLRGGACDWQDVCPIHVAWSRAQRALIGELETTTFGELANIDAAITEGTYEPPAESPPHTTPRLG